VWLLLGMCALRTSGGRRCSGPCVPGVVLKGGHWKKTILASCHFVTVVYKKSAPVRTVRYGESDPGGKGTHDDGRLQFSGSYAGA
jgi:hypothetical protein